MRIFHGYDEVLARLWRKVCDLAEDFASTIGHGADAAMSNRPVQEDATARCPHPERTCHRHRTAVLTHHVVDAA